MKKKLIDLTDEEFFNLCYVNKCSTCPFNFKKSIHACGGMRTISIRINEVEKYLASNSKAYQFTDNLKETVEYLKTTEVEIEENK